MVDPFILPIGYPICDLLAGRRQYGPEFLVRGILLVNCVTQDKTSERVLDKRVLEIVDPYIELTLIRHTDKGKKAMGYGPWSLFLVIFPWFS